MKYILLLRHAKSSHDDSSLKDFARPLALRGKKDAPEIGKFLKKLDFLPGAVISSTAKRAAQTTRLCLEGAKLNEEIVRWTEDLYYGSSDDYLKMILENKQPADILLLVGHNPDISETARRLCGGSVRMATAALTCFEQPANEWNQIREELASLKWMVTPDLLKKIQQK